MGGGGGKKLRHPPAASHVDSPPRRIQVHTNGTVEIEFIKKKKKKKKEEKDKQNNKKKEEKQKEEKDEKEEKEDTTKTKKRLMKKTNIKKYQKIKSVVPKPSIVQSQQSLLPHTPIHDEEEDDMQIQVTPRQESSLPRGYRTSGAELNTMLRNERNIKIQIMNTFWKERRDNLKRSDQLLYGCSGSGGGSGGG